MKYLLLCWLFAGVLKVGAQSCDETTILQTPGKWKAGMKGSEGGTTAELLQEKKTVAAIHTMIKDKYTPMSVEANYNGVFGYRPPGMPVNNFAYRIIPLNYYCKDNLVKTEHETSTYFSINANLFDSEIYDTVADNNSLLGFYTMHQLPAERNGCWYFEEKDVTLGFGIPGKSSMWLITYDGKLPFSYVSKKEFLQKRIKTLTQMMAESAGQFKTVLDNIEIEKKYKETEYKNDPAKMERYMKMDYLQIKERYQKMLAENEATYQPAFDKVNDLLQLPGPELDEKAIVKQDTHDHLAYLFTDDKDPFATILIKPNPGYFNKKLPRSSPQFFWVSITGDPGNPVAANFMADIMKAVNFSTLKNMLGK